MIVRRRRKAMEQAPRAIVRRSKHAVGARSGAIVRRQRWVAPPVGGGRSLLSWRPSKRFFVQLGMLVVFAGLASGGAWAWRSPLFEINNVEVVGNSRVPTDSILARTALVGEKMFTANLAEAQQSIYAIPLLVSVKVERDWPDTVRIVVEERQPWGTWEQGGVRYTIDRDGVVIGTTNPAPEGSPAIASDQSEPLELGDRVDYRAVDAAAEIYEKLPRQLGTTVSEVRFLGSKGVQVTTADGQSALLGDSSSIAYKLAVWAAVSTQAARQGINYTSIDLRYGNRPVLQ